MALVLSIRTQGSLAAAEQLPDLTAEGYDGAVWLWQVDDARAAQWVSRRLAKNQRVLVDAPCFIAQAGQPASVEALKLHACLVVREGRTTSQAFNVWPLQNGKACDTLQTVRVTGPLCSNSGELVRDWCLAGRGIMLRSLWDIAPQLSTGQLIRGATWLVDVERGHSVAGTASA